METKGKIATISYYRENSQMTDSCRARSALPHGSEFTTKGEKACPILQSALFRSLRTQTV